MPAQKCPICGAQQSLEATRCSECGAALSGVPVINSPQRSTGPGRKSGPKPRLEGPTTADWDEGEADLHEGMLPSLPLGIVTVSVVVFILIVGGFFVLMNQGSNLFGQPTATATKVAFIFAGTPSGPTATMPPTNTPIPIPSVVPTLVFATVTPAPPTPSITPTRGPCMQKAGKGDTLYGMASRCGHRNLSIVDVIVQLNGLKSANSVQEGQVIEIPWPTPTDNGQGNAGATANGGTPGDTSNVEPTLPPGVMWYTVKKGQTAIAVAYIFGTTMSALRDLNPEIQFLQCDFGLPAGGPDCTLRPPLGEGQRVRVPAPVPSATVSVTPNGSETATPTPTATFNAPYADSPGNNMLYEAAQLPALRWVASGELDPNQVYLITVTDKITNVVYHGTTRDLAFQVPAEWQPSDGKRHLFEWSVAVASKDNHGTPIPSTLATETRTFSWDSR